jgi:hypothetical protein
MSAIRRLLVTLFTAMLCAPLPGWTATPVAKAVVPQRAGGAGVPVLIYHEVVTDFRTEGETVISGVHHIDRGYDDLVGRLAAVGASIDRVHSSGS